jgi:hypothetical protein
MLMQRSFAGEAPADKRNLREAAETYRNAPPPKKGSRLASFVPASYDAAAHTVEVIMSSGSDVQRFGYTERLLIDPAAIDLSRVASGAVKVLNSHNAWDIGAILGTIVSARVAGGQLIGLCKFGATPAAIEAEGMVARGELTSGSIGYTVELWRAVEVLTDPASGVEMTIWRADAWTLMEWSFCAVPADPTAGVRSADPNPSGEKSANSGGAIKDDEMLTRNAPSGAPPATAAPAMQFTADEALDFLEQARSFGVDEEARRLVREKTAPHVARAAIMKAAADKQHAETSAASAGSAARVISEGSDAQREGMIEALVSRASGKAPSERARAFMGMSFLDVARARTPGLNPRERDAAVILRAANTTSDFPLLLESAANKILLDRYAVANPSYRAIAKRRDLNDFKTNKLLRIGDFPSLEKYLEDGEIKSGTVNEGRETAMLASYGKILRLSRQAIVNDDTSAFEQMFSGIAVTVSLFENAAFLAQKGTVGPALSDGKAVFHTDHGNLAASGAAIAVDTLGAARQAMRTQKNLDGNVLNIVATTLYVGAAKETEAEQMVAALTPHQTSDVNPFSGKLQVVAEGAITGNAWEVYADPNLWPVWSYGYLASAPGPRVVSKEDFDYDGMAWRVTLDFYAAPVDFRAAYRNPGA